MVCSKEDSWNQTKMECGDKNSEANRSIDILTPEGKTLTLSLGENTDIRKIKNECELQCGVPSDLQLIQLQGRDLSNDSTLSSLDISDGCTLRVTVPQWWQKFVSTCYKGDTQQVKKRIYVKMSHVSREERSFTAAFIAAVQGNHNLMFAAFVGRKINLHSKTKLSGRNLLHAAVSGGSTSCVANVLMNGGNALLEAADNTGETPVKMAQKLYGEEGSMIKFLNVYLELHRREANHSGLANRYWDNLEENIEFTRTDKEESSDHVDLSKSRENLITNLQELNIHHDEAARKYYSENEFLVNNSNQEHSSVGRVNSENNDANAGEKLLVVTSGEAEGMQEDIGDNPIGLSFSGQGSAMNTDTGYYSSCNQSVRKDVTKLLLNEDLFVQSNAATTQSERTKQQLNLGEQTETHAITNDGNNQSISLVDTSGDRDSDTSRWSKPRRRAQQRKLVFLEQRRRRSTTERPNLDELAKLRSDSIMNEAQESEQTESRDDEKQITESREKESDTSTCGAVISMRQGEETGSAVSSSIHDQSDASHSSKPLRRAQLRKMSIIEQRRKRSKVERPNIAELETATQNNEGCGNKEENYDNNPNRTPEGKRSNSSGNNLENNSVEDMSSGMQEPSVTGCDTRVNFEKNEEDHRSVNFQKLTEGPKQSAELFEDESPAAKYVLKIWQEQAHEADKAGLSGEESDTGRSPKLLRRAFRRKQAYMEQRRRKSATERPNLIKLMSRNIDDDEDETKDVTDMESEENGENKPSGAENNFYALLMNQGDITSDIPVDYSGERFSMKEQSSVDDSIKGPSSQVPRTSDRIPIRTAQRCSSNGPLLEGRARKSISSVSGEESSGSDQEKVVKETVAPIDNLTKTGRRRRLPLPPEKRIKLPVIKIEASETSQVNVSMKAPHPPLGRTRSGSMCSEDSVSSVPELSSERRR